MAHLRPYRVQGPFTDRGCQFRYFWAAVKDARKIAYRVEALGRDDKVLIQDLDSDKKWAVPVEGNPIPVPDPR